MALTWCALLASHACMYDMAGRTKKLCMPAEASSCWPFRRRISCIALPTCWHITYLSYGRTSSTAGRAAGRSAQLTVSLVLHIFAAASMLILCSNDQPKFAAHPIFNEKALPVRIPAAVSAVPQMDAPTLICSCAACRQCSQRCPLPASGS